MLQTVIDVGRLFATVATLPICLNTRKPMRKRTATGKKGRGGKCLSQTPNTGTEFTSSLFREARNSEVYSM